MPITRLNHFKAKEASSEELGTFLKSLIPYISNSKGCLACDVLQNKDDSSSYIVIEKWETIEDHQASIANFPKEDMQAAMPLLAAPPSGNYYEP